VFIRTEVFRRQAALNNTTDTGAIRYCSENIPPPKKTTEKHKTTANSPLNLIMLD
jgi:hypothetical protein